MIIAYLCRASSELRPGALSPNGPAGGPGGSGRPESTGEGLDEDPPEEAAEVTAAAAAAAASGDGSAPAAAAACEERKAACAAGWFSAMNCAAIGFNPGGGTAPCAPAAPGSAPGGPKPLPKGLSSRESVINNLSM